MDHTRKTLTSGWSLALLVSSVLLAACDPGPSTPTPKPISGPLGVLNLNFEQTKKFVFDWSPVANATHYVLEEKPDGDSGFSVIADNIDPNLTQYRLTVPLYRRTQALYRLSACLPDQTKCPLVGETQVAVNDVAQLVNSIGYFKGFKGLPEDNEAQLEFFGNAIALSEDGTTLAVGADFTDTIKLEEAEEASRVEDAGTVFIYRQNANGEWQQDQQLHAVLPNEADNFGHSLSLSADGQTLAVGAYFESNDQTGVTMNPESAELKYNNPEESTTDSGAVYLFTRNNADTAAPWHATAYIKDEAPQQFKLFGQSVSLNADGTALAVGAPWDTLVLEEGNVHLYQLDDSAAEGESPTWQFIQTLQVGADTAQHDGFGYTVSLDANGTWLAVGTYGEASDTGAVYLFNRTEEVDNPWQFRKRLQASNAGERDSFGSALSLSADGNTLAVGALFEDGNAIGILQGESQPTPQNDNADTSESEDSGAVYLFTRTGGTSTWQQQAYLKAPNRDAGDHFGTSVSLNRDGSQLIVGAPYEDSLATGLEGETGNDTEAANNYAGAGAAYYYRRSGTTWLSPVYLKSSNAGPSRGRRFGASVAISGDGETLVVGTSQENGAATGINGDQTSRTDGVPTGAVYLY
ncbi:FG-GAP repeat protein [Saccharospirillum mangrovi]|uniref:FG-GAP repeat protein n=1 Tax=Saccharospirillum mangrovi TaxID=2161747 RepID=UPI000D3599DC|nr:FG-GAP repeat protein [Saccharospirillum mangrovi]